MPGVSFFWFITALVSAEYGGERPGAAHQYHYVDDGLRVYGHYYRVAGFLRSHPAEI